MAKREVRVYLDDILESIELIEKYIANLAEEDFLVNTEKQDAIIRRLKIMGEATKQIPTDFRNMFPMLPWKKVAGLRDVAIHHYFGVSPKRIWKIVINDLPPLKIQILGIIKTL